MSRRVSDGRRVTLQDIADATGLSLASVSLALNDREGISSENRQRVIQVARELNYERLASRPRTARRTVSLIVERLPVSVAADPFNRPIIEGLEAAARQHGYRIMMEFVSPSDHPGSAHWSQGATDGVIILGGGDLSPEWVQAAVDAAIPVVMLDHVVPGLDLPAVIPDNLAGAHSITRHLLDMGHRRIGFIRGPSKYWTLSERLAGFMLALQQAGVWPREELMPPRVSHSEEKGYGEMQILLDLPKPPTAVVAVSDKTAVGAYRAIIERGLAIPQDISIVGFDDIEVARALNPPLTTVHVPGAEIGRVGFERLRHLIEGEENGLSRQIKWTIPTRLVHRGSVRSVSGD
ncbi:MAG TPA: LacI family DNA-binding transcriptional regulator [Thermomicrobiales bacterium]|nr:LacI family DNA-binding transcriptional regulator [Thermomicrobiales bacterium]